MGYWSRILALPSGRVGVFAELCWVAWHVQYWFIILPISKSIPGHWAMLLAKVFTWTIPKCAICRMAKKMWWLLFGGSAGFLHERPSLWSDNSYWLTLCVCVCSVAKLCPALCDPIDCSPPGSSIRGISQARILEWVAISSSRVSSWPRDGTHISHIDRWVPYHWTTREAWMIGYLHIKHYQILTHNSPKCFASLLSHIQCMRVNVSSSPLQHLAQSDFLVVL